MLDDVVHQRVRLGILAALAGQDRVGFTTLRDLLGQPDSGMSRHLRVLENAGLVLADKVIEDRRPKTWVSLTDAGRAALTAEFAALRSMMSAIEVLDPLAFTMLLDDRPAAPPAALRELVLDEGPAGFRLLHDAPIDDRFELPPGAPRWDRQPQQALALRSHGLRGGHLRGWRRGAQARLHILAVELGSLDAPVAILDTLAPSTFPVPGLASARAYWFDEHGADPVVAVCWLANGPYLACVTAQGRGDLVRDLGPGYATRQYEHLGERWTREAGTRTRSSAR